MDSGTAYLCAVAGFAFFFKTAVDQSKELNRVKTELAATKTRPGK